MEVNSYSEGNLATTDILNNNNQEEKEKGRTGEDVKRPDVQIFLNLENHLLLSINKLQCK